ncbi:MAG: hypothetical protein ACRD5D_05545, partial [Candidatus Polarisedimenticolia bacterium]
PEILDPRDHAACLYRDTEDLIARLDALLAEPGAIGDRREPLAASMERYSRERVGGAFDAELDRLAGARA